MRKVKEILSVWRGRLLDEDGIDWWNFVSVLIAQDVLTVLELHNVAEQITSSDELWVSRPGGSALLLSSLLNREIGSFARKGVFHAASGVGRYAGLIRRFSFAQIKEIFLDKYDPGYEFRARFARSNEASSGPVVLVPSAYKNVSRMAAAYARLLPQQKFLVVTTRHSGTQFDPPANMTLRELASYAHAGPTNREEKSLLKRWRELRQEMRATPELEALDRSGKLNAVEGWIKHGISIRDAWRQVLDREPVCGVLCGDDSNRSTLLPVLLASRKNIPTVDFHHGAFDGRYLLKDVPCDVYLAKNEMERDYLLRVCGLDGRKVQIAAPAPSRVQMRREQDAQKSAIVFFSEPYEGVGMRGVEAYREILPRLCRLAEAHGRRVLVKLHPFESRWQRENLLREVLAERDKVPVSVIDGPLTDALMDQAWFGITVESTSALNCLQNGVQCFLCGWLKLSAFEYVDQYVRFGVGEFLEHPDRIAEIPDRLRRFDPAAVCRQASADPMQLAEWLGAGAASEVSGVPQ